MKEKIVTKVIKKWLYKYHSSFFFFYHPTKNVHAIVTKCKNLFQKLLLNTWNTCC